MQAHAATLSEDPDLTYTLSEIAQLPNPAIDAVFEAIYKTPADFPLTTCTTTLHHKSQTYREAMTCPDTAQ